MSEKTFWVAKCQDCNPVLPMPFDDENERDQWAAEHAGANGHTVTTTVEQWSSRERPTV